MNRPAAGFAAFVPAVSAIIATIAATIVALAVPTAHAQPNNPAYDRDAALAASQAAVGETLGDVILRDTGGQPFELAALRGRPLVISMIYTSCHHVCPLITRNLAETVDVAREALGDDAFSVVTLGFDWAVDTPDRMRMYASGLGIDDPRWHFLAGDSNSVAALAGDLGFRFFPSAKGFDHLSQTTVVTGDGRIYRQVYGVELDAPLLVEPLKELVYDTPREASLVRHWVDRFKLFCTVYDPMAGRYSFDYSIFTSIIVGVLCLGAVATFIAREWRRAR